MTKTNASKITKLILKVFELKKERAALDTLRDAAAIIDTPRVLVIDQKLCKVDEKIDAVSLRLKKFGICLM